MYLLRDLIVQSSKQRTFKNEKKNVRHPTLLAEDVKPTLRLRFKLKSAFFNQYSASYKRAEKQMFVSQPIGFFSQVSRKADIFI